MTVHTLRLSPTTTYYVTRDIPFPLSFTANHGIPSSTVDSFIFLALPLPSDTWDRWPILLAYRVSAALTPRQERYREPLFPLSKQWVLPSSTRHNYSVVWSVVDNLNVDVSLSATVLSARRASWSHTPPISSPPNMFPQYLIIMPLRSCEWLPISISRSLLVCEGPSSQWAFKAL